MLGEQDFASALHLSTLSAQQVGQDARTRGGAEARTVLARSCCRQLKTQICASSLPSCIPFDRQPQEAPVTILNTCTGTWPLSQYVLLHRAIPVVRHGRLPCVARGLPVSSPEE